jgi:hypothetical protein
MKRVLWLGALLWGALFAIASALYPMSVDNRALFGSLMAVVIACSSVGVASAYLRDLHGHLFWRVLVASCTWVVTCWLLDLLAMSLLPPRYSFAEYVKQLGVDYLMIPVIALGLAYQRVRFGRLDTRAV